MFDSRGWWPGRFLLKLCLLLAAAGRVPLTHAAVLPPAIEDVQTGVDGLMKPGSWCRIRVAVSGEGQFRLEAVTPDPFGNPVIYSSETFTPSQHRQTDLFIKPGRLQTAITIRLVDLDDGAVLDSRRLVSAATSGGTGHFRVVRHSVPTALFCGGFSNSTVLASSGESSDREEESAALLSELRESGAEISRINPGDLPADWRTLAAYRTIILTREFDLPVEQSRALQQWVSQGGQLVIAAGVGARTLVARTPGETVTAMLDLLDAGGLRELRSEPLGSLLARLELRIEDGIREAGVPELLDTSLNELPAALDALKLEPARSRQLRDSLRTVHRDLVSFAQNRVNTVLKDGTLGSWALRSATLTATTLSDLTGLETFVSSSWSIPVSGRHWGTIIADESARSLATGLEGTLLTRGSYGCGRVTVCGVALDQSPVSRWKEAGTFLQTLIEQPFKDTTEGRDRRRISSSGIEELGTQLYAA
jgi:hypothetical protein